MNLFHIERDFVPEIFNRNKKVTKKWRKNVRYLELFYLIYAEKHVFRHAQPSMSGRYRRRKKY